jgi:hypothetical protein
MWTSDTKPVVLAPTSVGPPITDDYNNPYGSSGTTKDAKTVALEGRWDKRRRDLLDEMSKLDMNEFDKQLVDVNNKAADLRQEFSKIAGASSDIDAWAEAMSLDIAKKRGIADIMRQEQLLQSDLFQIGMDEANKSIGRYDALNAEILVYNELLEKQKEHLATIDGQVDPDGWISQNDNIMKTQQALINLAKEARKYTASMSEGMKDGIDDYVDSLGTYYEQMYKLSQDTGAAIRDTFADVFDDALTGKLDSFEDYFVAFTDRLRSAFVNALADMATQNLLGALGFGANFQSYSNVGSSGGLLSSLLGSGMSLLSASFSGSSSYDASTSVTGGALTTPLPTKAYADGGWITEPVVGIGTRSRSRYLIGENDDELIVPKDQVNGNATHYSFSADVRVDSENKKLAARIQRAVEEAVREEVRRSV